MRCSLAILLFFLAFSLKAQPNLVSNWSFEDTVSCPTTIGQISKAKGWGDATQKSTSDYWHTCAGEVPFNGGGYQFPRTGTAYAGIYNYQYIPGIVEKNSEYMQNRLLDSLLPGVVYHVGFYVSPAEMMKYYCNNVGAYFSRDSVFRTDTVLNFVPQVSNDYLNNPLTDTAAWILVQDTFTAVGGEKFMIIGNFFSGPYIDTVFAGGPYIRSAYLFIDDVSVTPLDSLPCDTAMAGFSYVGSGRTLSFSDNSVNALRWKWDFGDGNTSLKKSPVHTYSDYGSYTVTLIASNFCTSDTVRQTITFCDTVQAGFNFSHTGTTVHFTNASQYSTSLLWDFGDGSTSASLNPSHAYNAYGSYTVTLIAVNGCSSDTLTQTIYFCDTVKAGFIFTASPAGVLFTDTSFFASNWNWDFGDGNFSSQQHPQHHFADTGWYAVRLIASNACSSDTVFKNIYFPCLSPALASFSYSVNDSTVYFTNASQNGSSYYWQFGDGSFSTSQNPVQQYSDTGNYTVQLVAKNFCSSDTFTLNVYVPCRLKTTAAFRYEVKKLKVNFSNLSTHGSQYWWDFGDGNFSELPSPEHSFADNGTYLVSLIAAGICNRDTVVKKVVVSQPYGFSVYPNPNNGNMQLEYQLQEGQKGAFSLYDLTAKLLTEVKLEDGQRNLSITEDKMVSGIYFYRFMVEGELVKSGKVIILK
jgi:PKD repeat protein